MADPTAYFSSFVIVEVRINVSGTATKGFGPIYIDYLCFLELQGRSGRRSPAVVVRLQTH